jgi:HPP family
MVTFAGPQPWAAAVAVGIAMAVMHVTDSLHPPARINPATGTRTMTGRDQAHRFARRYSAAWASAAARSGSCLRDSQLCRRSR